jgi:hypothetical protein
MDSLVKNSLIIIFALGFLVFAPILTIMSLNQLFDLGITITFWSWASVVWLNMTVLGGLSASIKHLKK